MKEICRGDDHILHWMGFMKWSKRAFPPPLVIACIETPYLYNLVISVIFFIIFTALNAVTTAADFEMSPIAEGLLVSCHSRVEVSVRLSGRIYATWLLLPRPT